MTGINRPLPSCQDAEKGILGSILLTPDKSLATCQQNKLEGKWFHSPHHETIYTALLEMSKAGIPIDLISVTQYLEDQKLLDNCGGAAYVTDLFTFCVTASNLAYYIHIVREKYALRLAILECTTLAAEFYEGGVGLQEVYDKTAKAFIEVREVCVESETDNYDQKAMMEFLDEMEAVASGKAAPEFFRTGIRSIDEECGGLVRGELMMVRGRSGVGKSLTAQKVVSVNAFSAMQAKAAIFTYEMPFRQYVSRLVADLGTIHLKSIRDGRYSKGELDSFMKSMTKLMESNIKIYDTFRIKKRDPATFFSYCRKHARRHGLDIAVLDHAHLLDLDGKTDKRKDEAMSEVFAEFKSMCLELRCAGIVLAQENTDGGTFGCSQASTHADSSWSLVPIWKVIGGIKRIVGASGIFCDKARQGNLLGKTIPIKLEGQYARISEQEEAVREADF